MWYDERYKQRRIEGVAKAAAKRLGNERRAQPRRRCPVDGCPKEPRYYSRYCANHADRLRRNGHPTLRLSTKTQRDYAECLKIGRWLRQAMTKDEADQRAWARVEGALNRFGRDPRFKHGIPTLARRDKSWRNEFKAKCYLSRRLEQIDTEEVLAAFLGLSSVVIEGNDVPVGAKQFEHFIQKSGGKAVTRYMRTTALDPESEKVFRWKPSTGVITKLGKVIFDEIAKEFGARWWKEAEVALVTRHASSGTV